MSALARMLLQERKTVTGSDRSVSDITCGLSSLGIKVYETHEAANITGDVDLVVVTSAVKEDNVEVLAAKERGIEVREYAEVLGMAVNSYYLIAVTGTHGKTTTTAMLTDVFEEAGYDPTAIVGSLRSKTKSNFRPGKSKYAVVEADDYQRHFLHLKPDVLVILNLEFEHVDYYKDLTDVQDAFRTLVSQVPEDGAVVTDVHNENIAPILNGLKCEVIDYKKSFDPLLQMKQPGLHVQLNAAAALAAAAFVGIKAPVAKKALSNFAGTWRRFEFKGEINGAPIYDDYCHHPSEIRATLEGAREKFPNKKLVTVYQPHTYSRTHELFDGFANELAKADQVFLLPIYAAREENESGVSSKKLVETIREKNPNVQFSPDFESATAGLRDVADPDSVILIMGAGDVINVSKRLIS